MPPPIEPCALVFRVRDERGPLARAELDVSIELRRRSQPRPAGSSRQPLLTDAAGFLRCELASYDSDDAVEFTLTVASADTWCQRTGLVTRGEMRIEEDLVLAPMPVLAAGTVVGADGKPVSGARVVAPDESGLHELRSTTGADGGFVLYASRNLESTTQPLVAAHGEWISAVRQVTEGERDVVLVLSTRTGSFAGRVLLAPGIAHERIDVQLQALDSWPLGFSDQPDLEAPDPLAGWRYCVPDAGGGFVFSHRNPGMHRVRVLADSHELIEIRDVLVEAGATRTDARCDPIDLRGKIHERRIRLRAPDPTAELSGTFLLCKPGSREADGGGFEGSELFLLSPYIAPDVLLRVHGFRIVRLAGLREHRDLLLEPGWPVRLVLNDDIPLPEPPVSWSVVLLGREVGLPTFFHFDSGKREARGIAEETGELEVAWVRAEGVVPDERNWRPWIRGGTGGWPRQTVHVADAPGEQTLRLGWVPVAR